MSQVQKYSHSVLEHCICLLPLFFAVLVRTQITRFVLIKTNHKISHLKGLQRTVSNIHIVYQNIVCPSYYFYLLMVVEINALRCYGMHTNKHDFGSEIMNNMVTDDYNRWVGAQTSTQCTRTMYFPPTTFLFLWLRNDIHFNGVEGTKTTTA